ECGLPSTPVNEVSPVSVHGGKLPVSKPPLTTMQAGVPVAVGVGEGVPPPAIVPVTPMEKSVGWPCSAVFCQLAPKKLLLKNAFRSLPHGVPTQLAPLVFESNERPVRSPTTVTLSQ